MLLSMTGFGKAVVESPNKKFTVEIKSLNSKQLDLAMRIPAICRELEAEMRNIVAAEVVRGKVDLSIYSENLGAETDLNINLAKAQQYYSQLRHMGEALGFEVSNTDWIMALVRMPELFRSDAPASLEEADAAAPVEALRQAIAKLIEFRAVEGRKLDLFFRERIAAIAALLAEVPRFETERIAKIRARMEDALSKIPQADYDRNRYEQEMIFYIEKLDITEEKQRLSQHLDYFIKTLDADPGQGKKLGFIAQEMGREINTLGSKSNNAEMQIIVVKMKDELEQIKEQVLNVL